MFGIETGYVWFYIVVGALLSLLSMKRMADFPSSSLRTLTISLFLILLAWPLLIIVLILYDITRGNDG